MINSTSNSTHFSLLDSSDGLRQQQQNHKPPSSYQQSVTASSSGNNDDEEEEETHTHNGFRQKNNNDDDNDQRRQQQTADAAVATAHYYSWKIADFGAYEGTRSRDGSLHATDEVFNAASHLSATLFSILGTVLLIVQSCSTSQQDQDQSTESMVYKIVSFSIYGASLVNLFACSTLHHSITGPPNVESFLRLLDYLAIYPLIAGTFTPLCLVFYHDSSIGWAFCGCVWGIAIIGMMATASCFIQIPKWLSMTMYITLGWMGACMTYWLIPVLGYSGMGIFLLGGIFYTVGGYVYTTEHPNPFPGRFGFHEIWHVTVCAGALTHWILMYTYVLPWESPD